MFPLNVSNNQIDKHIKKLLFDHLIHHGSETLHSIRLYTEFMY